MSIADLTCDLAGGSVHDAWSVKRWRSWNPNVLRILWFRGFGRVTKVNCFLARLVSTGLMVLRPSRPASTLFLHFLFSPLHTIPRRVKSLRLFLSLPFRQRPRETRTGRMHVLAWPPALGRRASSHRGMHRRFWTKSLPRWRMDVVSMGMRRIGNCFGRGYSSPSWRTLNPLPSPNVAGSTGYLRRPPRRI